MKKKTPKRNFEDISMQQRGQIIQRISGVIKQIIGSIRGKSDSEG